MIKQNFHSACKRLEEEGFCPVDEQWSGIDADIWETARALHPDGSYQLYKRKKKLNNKAS